MQAVQTIAYTPQQNPRQSKTTPAKTIRLTVSAESTCIRRYPVLITGIALPHKIQQTHARSATIPVFVNVFCFCVIFCFSLFIYISYFLLYCITDFRSIVNAIRLPCISYLTYQILSSIFFTPHISYSYFCL